MVSALVKSWKDRCLQSPGRIGLPESSDPRTIQAAVDLLSEGSFAAVHFYEPHDIVMTKAAELEIDLEAYKDRIHWSHPSNGSDIGPLDTCAEDLHEGHIDVALAGAVHTTAAVIRSAISNVGLAQGCRTISGLFMMNKALSDGTQHTMAYADAGVVIEPTVEQLSDIAWSTAQTWRCLMGTDAPPKLAFLSFSTNGSAKHPSVDKVTEALKLFRARHPEIQCDGEMQFDAAYVESIGKRKFPESTVAGQVNCFIFPNLDAGNICYKVTQRLAGYEAYGPILQGTRKPFSDLSRGATADDIKASAYINLLRARS